MLIQDILKQKWVIPAAVGVAGVATGFGVGFFTGRKTAPVVTHHVLIKDVEPSEFTLEQERLKAELEMEFEEVSEQEELVQEHLINYAEDSVVEDDESEEDEPEENEGGFYSVNVFDPVATEWDEEAEVRARVDGEPYIINVAEFIAHDNEWHQETVTFYEGDGIMATSENAPVYNYDTLMGELKFGHGSGSADVVYIRNPVARMEWEVLRDSGKFEEEVLGLSLENEYEEQDLKHSAVRRFRDD